MQNTLFKNEHAENSVEMMKRDECVVVRCRKFSSHALMLLFSLVNGAPFCILDMAIKSLMQWRPEHQGTRYSAATCCSKSDTTNTTHKRKCVLSANKDKRGK